MSVVYHYYISWWKFETSKFCVTTIDSLGHGDYVENTISDTFQSDCAVLSVVAGAGECEASISKNGQTCGHAILAYTLRVKQLMVGVSRTGSNKLLYRQKRGGNCYGSQHLHQGDWLQS